MIGSLAGRLAERWGAGEVLVEVHGVGYRVTVTPTTAVSLGEAGSDVRLYVHHHRREDAEVLFGFADLEELHCFEALIGAHGVGPSLGLAILGVHSPVALVKVVADGDLAALCLVPGVGKKTAERLMVELKTRLDLTQVGSGSGTGPHLGAGSGASPRSDVRDALANLGYGSEEVGDVLRSLPEDGEPSEMLRRALQLLAAG